MSNSILDKAIQRKADRTWLKYSQEIALVVLNILEQKKISQKELANKMNVSPQYINKLVRGKEKLNIETISKLEEALEINILHIAKL